MRTKRRLRHLGRLQAIALDSAATPTDANYEPELCWFCGRLILRKRLGNIHHLMPRRYYQNKADADRDNTVHVHVLCHQQWNCRHDKPMHSAERYRQYMESLDWGENIFYE